MFRSATQLCSPYYKMDIEILAKVNSIGKENTRKDGKIEQVGGFNSRREKAEGFNFNKLIGYIGSFSLEEEIQNWRQCHYYNLQYIHRTIQNKLVYPELA